jgi:hypothetical protein
MSEQSTDLNAESRKWKSWAIDPLAMILGEFHLHLLYVKMTAAAIKLFASDEVEKIIDGIPNNMPAKGSIYRELDIIEYQPAAVAEIENNYKNLVEQAVVGQFAYLESGIRRLIMAIYLNDQSQFVEERIKKISFSFIDIKNLSDLELSERFLRQLDNLIVEPYGFQRFEKYLQVAGLDGLSMRNQIEKTYQRDITEHAQIRNLIVHKSGVVDSFFILQCPWLKVNVGEKIKLNLDDLNRYFMANAAYMKNLLRRIAIKRGFYRKNEGPAD